MSTLLTSDPNALKLLLTEDIYYLKETQEPVSIPITPVATVMHEATPEKLHLNFNYSGENNRYFLILFEGAGRNELSNEHKDMLLKIMAAKSLELRDLAIVNIALYPQASFEDLKHFFSCNRIVLFGVNPAKISLPPIPANMPEKHADVKVLTTFSLDEMNSNTNKKREFWSVMKGF